LFGDFCLLMQDPILELDRTSLGESVVGLFAAIVSCISGGYKSQSTLLILVSASVNLDIKKVIYA